MKFTGKDGTVRIYERSGGYLEVHFLNMDFSGPIGRSRADEILVMDNGKINQYAHYITGTDQIVFDSLPVSFSCLLEDVSGLSYDVSSKEVDLIYQALICRYPVKNLPGWTWEEYGWTTKGTTSNKSGIMNPEFMIPDSNIERVMNVTSNNPFDPFISVRFSDLTGSPDVINRFSGYIFKNTETGECSLCERSSRVSEFEVECIFPISDFNMFTVSTEFEVYNNLRTVDLEIKFDSPENNDIVWVFSETYFPKEEINISESEEGINISVTGGVYGEVKRSSEWINPSL